MIIQPWIVLGIIQPFVVHSLTWSHPRSHPRSRNTRPLEQPQEIQLELLLDGKRKVEVPKIKLLVGHLMRSAAQWEGEESWVYSGQSSARWWQQLQGGSAFIASLLPRRHLLPLPLNPHANSF